MITDDVAWLLIEGCRHLGKPMRGLRVCELGNQESGWTLRVPIKTIMQWLGAEHTSIDMNGRDGSLAFDLSQPLPDYLLHSFDFVTNAGTTEHVATLDGFMDQYVAFKNIHDLTTPWSTILHVLPNEKGAHCGCGYVYTRRFFEKLAIICGYSILASYDSKSDANHMVCLYRRANMHEFPTYKDFLTIGEIVATKDHPNKPLL